MCPNLKIWSEKKPLYGFLPILYLFHMIELSNLTSGGAVFFFVFFSNISVMTDGIDYIQHFNKQEVHIVLHLRLNIYIKQYLFFFSLFYQEIVPNKATEKVEKLICHCCSLTATQNMENMKSFGHQLSTTG